MTRMISPATPLDLYVAWQPPHPGGAAFLSGVDNDTGTVRMMGGGIWRPDDAQRYFDQQWLVIEQARRRFGKLKILMDVRDWVIENPDSVSQFDGINRELFRAEDRLAAVVRTSLDKQASRDALATGVREAFVSSNAAEMWLHAYSTAG